MQHLVLIDGHHLLYRAYWAIPRTMRTSKGEQVNTAFGVASMLINILKTEQPDAVLFCFDEGDETFRHLEYAEYKAGRAETPEDFYPQVPRVFEFIDTLGIQRTSLKSHEADDLLCGYARAAVERGSRVTIVTGDRDALQLASEHIKIAVPSKGYREPEYFGPSEVQKAFGITPDQIPSYKGLVGDSSDNLPGVHGIGPKAAEALLRRYGTLEGIYEHIEEVPAKWKEKLVADRESAFMCERMAELVCDFAFPLALEDLMLMQLPLGPVLNFCRDMEFSLIARRINDLASTPYGRTYFIPDASMAMTSAKQVESDSPQLSLL